MDLITRLKVLYRENSATLRSTKPARIGLISDRAAAECVSKCFSDLRWHFSHYVLKRVPPLRLRVNFGPLRSGDRLEYRSWGFLDRMEGPVDRTAFTTEVTNIRTNQESHSRSDQSPLFNLR